MQNIFYPLEQLYKFLYLSVYDITGNYGIALILLSLLFILFSFRLIKKRSRYKTRNGKYNLLLHRK